MRDEGVSGPSQKEQACSYVKESVSASRELTIETGRMAKQADGSVVVRYGDTMVLVTAVASSTVRPGIDFHAADGRLPREDVRRRAAFPAATSSARGA